MTDPVETVALFLPSLEVGGAEKVFVQLANALAGRLKRVDLVLMDSGGPLRKNIAGNVAIVDLGHRRYREATRALARYFDRHEPAVIISSLYATGLSAIVARMISRHKPRVIVSGHNSFRSKVDRPDNIKDRFLLEPLARLLFPRADAFIAVSQGVALDMQTSLRLAPGKFNVIYNPVVNDELLGLAEAGNDHRWLQSPRRFRTLVTVGRLVEQKGYDVLIHAFRQVAERIDCRLIVVGDGPQLSILRALSEREGVSDRIDFVGLQENPLKFVTRADLFVLSSRWEGLPTVLIEALACGCRIVSTNCPHGPDEILCGGKYGRLAHVADPVSLADAIVESLSGTAKDEDEVRFLRERSMDFSVEKSVDAYVRVMEETCQGPGSRSPYPTSVDG